MKRNQMDRMDEMDKMDQMDKSKVSNLGLNVTDEILARSSEENYAGGQ